MSFSSAQSHTKSICKSYYIWPGTHHDNILASHLLQQSLKEDKLGIANSKASQGFNDTLNCYAIFQKAQTLSGTHVQWSFLFTGCSMPLETELKIIGQMRSRYSDWQGILKITVWHDVTNPHAVQNSSSNKIFSEEKLMSCLDIIFFPLGQKGCWWRLKQLLCALPGMVARSEVAKSYPVLEYSIKRTGVTMWRK